MGPVIKKLKKSNDIHNLQRFWIVNGFNCLATDKACRELTGLSSVAYLYPSGNSRPTPKQQKPAAEFKPPNATQKAKFEAMLKRSKDDSRTPLPKDVVPTWNVAQIKADQVWGNRASMVKA